MRLGFFFGFETLREMIKIKGKKYKKESLVSWEVVKKRQKRKDFGVVQMRKNE